MVTDVFYPNIDGVKLKNSHIPLLTYKTHRFNTWQDKEELKEAFEASCSMARGEIKSLLLWGSAGTGKSHLALAVAWQYLCKGYSVLYYRVGELLDALRKGYERQYEGTVFSYESIMHHASRVKLLVLDDMGAEKSTDWAMEKLDSIVDYRYINNLATIITANTLDISDRILDRMREGKIVLLVGESYRKRLGKDYRDFTNKGEG